MATPTKLAPKSGFTTPQFYIGLLAVVGTFVLGLFGANIDLTKLPDFVKNLLGSNIVLGAIVVAVIAGFIAVSSWVETNTVRKVGPTKGRPAKHEAFYQTSEFWLGLVTVVLSYLDSTGALKTVFHITTDVHAATNTTTLVIALVYTFARSQLKQAYANAQAQGN